MVPSEVLNDAALKKLFCKKNSWNYVILSINDIIDSIPLMTKIWITDRTMDYLDT